MWRSSMELNNSQDGASSKREASAVKSIDAATPELTAREREALATLITRFDSWKLPWPASLKESLDRLIRPIAVVLQKYVDDATYRTAKNILLREIHYRQTTFWQWTSDEWVEVLNN